MSALDQISKRDNPQPRAAMVTMSRNALNAALSTIETEYRSGKLGPVGPLASTPVGQPAEVVTDRLWALLGGREGG